MDGICTLANDRVYDQLVAILNSIEVNCETDFVARNDEFRSFVKDLCLRY